jgi:hypothetical protein
LRGAILAVWPTTITGCDEDSNLSAATPGLSKSEARPCPLWVISGHFAMRKPCPLCAKSGLMHRGKNPVFKLGRAAAFQRLRVCNMCTHLRIGRSCGVCLTPGFYVRAMAIFEVMLALTFPSLRSGARCALIAAFNLSCVPAGDVARDGASGVASRALAA